MHPPRGARASTSSSPDPRGPDTVNTCSLVREGKVAIVIDPGLAPSQAAILDPLAALGLAPDDVTDVVISPP